MSEYDATHPFLDPTTTASSVSKEPVVVAKKCHGDGVGVAVVVSDQPITPTQKSEANDLACLRAWLQCNYKSQLTCNDRHLQCGWTELPKCTPKTTTAGGTTKKAIQDAIDLLNELLREYSREADRFQRAHPDETDPYKDDVVSVIQSSLNENARAVQVALEGFELPHETAGGRDRYGGGALQFGSGNNAKLFVYVAEDSVSCDSTCY